MCICTEVLLQCWSISGLQSPHNAKLQVQPHVPGVHQNRRRLEQVPAGLGPVQTGVHLLAEPVGLGHVRFRRSPGVRGTGPARGFVEMVGHFSGQVWGVGAGGGTGGGGGQGLGWLEALGGVGHVELPSLGQLPLLPPSVAVPRQIQPTDYQLLNLRVRRFGVVGILTNAT